MQTWKGGQKYLLDYSLAWTSKQSNMYYVLKHYENWQISLISLEMPFIFVENFEVKS